MSSRKGQSTVEMIITLGLLFVVFTIVILIAHTKTVESNEFKISLDAERICNSLAYNINTIAQQGPNYYRRVSIPRYLFGGHEYNLSVYGNYVEISWYGTYGPRTYGVQTITNDTLVYCNGNRNTIIDKGMDRKIQIFNDDGTILLTCGRPDLRPIASTFKPSRVSDGGTFNVSIDIINIGVNDSGAFYVDFNSTYLANITSPPIMGLESGKSTTVIFTIPISPTGIHNVSIFVDSKNNIIESIETDNYYNATIEINP